MLVPVLGLYVLAYAKNLIRSNVSSTLYQNTRSKWQQFKTGVPQGGVLSPTLFNLYTSDLPPPPANVSITTYADDMNPSSSHPDYHKAQDFLQPYLTDIFN
jgi:hypothetical protein